MVLDEQKIKFEELLKKANYLKECLWRDFFKQISRRKEKRARSWGFSPIVISRNLDLVK